MSKSFSTTVHTPRKNPGRNAPSRMSASSGGGATLNACGSGYISRSSGVKSTSTRSRSSFPQSTSKVRRYLSKSSVGANCSRFTKMVATTKLACERAIRISERWPSCRLPIVGTHATSASRSSRRSSAMVGTIFIGSFGDVEILAAPAPRRDVASQQLEVGVARHEVEVLGVDHEQRRLGVMVEEPAVSVGERREVGLVDRILVR